MGIYDKQILKYIFKKFFDIMIFTTGKIWSSQTGNLMNGNKMLCNDKIIHAAAQVPNIVINLVALDIFFFFFFIHFVKCNRNLSLIY